jgi:hypothetical protein
MKALSRLLLLVLLVMPAAFAQSSVTLSGQTASATVLAGLTLVNNQVLNFGKIVTSGTTGTAVMTTGGGMSYTGGITSAPGSATAAAFTVTGTTGQAVNLTIPATITLAGPSSSTMVITTSTDAATNPITLATGTLVFHIAGSLAVSATQTTGAYNATYAVTVAYN